MIGRQCGTSGAVTVWCRSDARSEYELDQSGIRRKTAS